MSDLICRQAAIDRIYKQREHLYPDIFEQDKIADMAYRICAEFIGRLPSAERRGSWVGIDDEPFEVWECDQCGNIVEREIPPKYCEECGARMEASE